jgi:hypothetical protein
MLRWMDGFEQYGTVETHMLEGVGGAAAWSQVDLGSSGKGWALASSNPATGTYHMRLTEENNGDILIMRRALGQSKQVSGFGYRFQVDDLPATEADAQDGIALRMLDFRDVANSQQIRITMGTEGSVRASRGNTALGRSDPCIAAGGYHHFEAKSKIDNTTGYVEVRINEVTVLNLTGIDTQSTANAETSQFTFGQDGFVALFGPGFGLFDVDDCFAWDDDASDAENTVVDFVGDKGCYYLPVNADTAEADWTLSTGVTGYSLLDEVPPSGTDYIDNTTGTARSIFGVAALPGNVSEVIAFMPVIYARKEESGTVNLRGGVVVGAEESYTATNSPSTAYSYMEPTPKTIDPDTGVAWASDANPDLLIERTA